MGDRGIRYRLTEALPNSLFVALGSKDLGKTAKYQ
nr:MAG TPA: hypothetical protein [Caudoviricetes sp.]